MDLDNAVIQLCIQGTRAEFAGDPEQARDLYRQAWQIAQDDYEACIAAHYVARFQDSPQETLRWNMAALEHADAVLDGRARTFYPSLYLNLAKSYELLGNLQEARRYYALAAEK